MVFKKKSVSVCIQLCHGDDSLNNDYSSAQRMIQHPSVCLFVPVISSVLVFEHLRKPNIHTQWFVIMSVCKLSPVVSRLHNKISPSGILECVFHCRWIECKHLLSCWDKETWGQKLTWTAPETDTEEKFVK